MTQKITMMACLVGSLVAPAPAESATLLQWLFPRLAARRVRPTAGYAPVSAYAPTTAGYGVTTANYGGCATCSSPQTGWYYQPQTNYRTVWSPVPVTSYQATTAAYGGTQACTGYDWQARRVPYVSYRPIFAGFGNYRRSLYGSTTPVTPNAGNYWTQFGSAGYSLPTSHRRGLTASPTTGFASPADIAPVLTAPPAVAAPTTAFSIPSYGYPTTTTLAPTTTYPATRYPSVTAGYPSAWEPVTTTAPSANATDWQPVPDSTVSQYREYRQSAPAESHSYTQNYGPSSSTSAYSLGTGAGSVAGATPWMPADEYERLQRPRVDRALEPVPADRRPQLEDPRTRSDSDPWDSYYDRQERARHDSDDARRRAYEQYGYGRSRLRPEGQEQDRALDVNLGRRQSGHSSSAEAQTVPYYRPIPDLDRREASNDRRERPSSNLDHAAHSGIRLLTAPEIDAALDEASNRWKAEPIGMRAPNASRDVREKRQVRDEGGWRQAR